MADEPVGAPAAALHVEAAAESAAGLQYAEGLAVRGLLVRKGVEAVQREDDVEGCVLKGKRTDVPLPEGDVPDPGSFCFFCADRIMSAE